MDEGDGEDVAAVSRAEDVRSQGKESEYMLESCNVLEPRERVSLREEDQPRSSIQQFVDILNGKDPVSAVNTVDPSQNPHSSCAGNAEGRVEELTLGHYSAGLSTMNAGEAMETMLNGWQHENQPGVVFQAGSSHEHPANIEKHPTKSSAPHPDQNAVGDPGQSTYHGSGSYLGNMLPCEGMRMKIISKASGSACPEYFVKNTLKGKGVVYRGPISSGAEFRGRNIVNTAPARTSSSDPPLNVREKPGTLSGGGAGGIDLGSSRESVSEGVSLREWMKSGQRKLNKVERLIVFKQILDLIYSLHSDGKVLVDLRPSCFRVLPSRKVKYCGRLAVQMEMHGSGSIMQKDIQKSQSLKRPLEQGMSPYFNLATKHQKFADNANFSKMKSQSHLGYGLKPITTEIDANLAGPGASGYVLEYRPNAGATTPDNSSRLQLPASALHSAFSAVGQLEEKWYRSPEEDFGKACTFSSNVYSLGVLMFELLSSFDSVKVHATAMSDLHHRILPPTFLSENPKEAGFCLWLLHPEPSLRPTARDILQSEVVTGFEAMHVDEKSPSSIQEDEGESELLLHFLMSLKEQKRKHALKLVEDLGSIEADIKELDKRHLLRSSASPSGSQEALLYARERSFLYNENGLSSRVSDRTDSRFLKNVAQLESAYLSTRSQIQASVSDSMIRSDRDVLVNRENWYTDHTDEEKQKPLDSLGDFYGGLCKYARYSKLEVCGTVRNREITNSTNVICSLSFDRDEDYFAAAGVSKKIKIFEFQGLCDDSVDIHYPVIEMSNKSKLSSVCWNNYIRNYLASTDYDGIVKLWDASTGQDFSQYTEHEKRAWSVDFSQLDPTKLASGSDDCSVKLWSINERSCLQTIRNIANVCCVQFSAYSSHLLAFGSADYKIYCYDLRNPNVPWCILAGHEKAVSYVKFVDSETLVSASTDNTLKVWDLNRSSSVGLSNNSCSLTLSGHTNEKNFVGLSVADGYIACGSETNEVYTYYKSLPMPITSHKFGSVDPISGKETDDDNGLFVSSVCWKGKSNVLVAANSSGCIKVLRMV